MNFLKKPFARDSTTNSSGEIFQRFGLVALGFGPLLLIIGGVRCSPALLVTGGVVLGLGLVSQLRSSRKDKKKEPAETTPPATPIATPPRIASASARPRIVLLNASLAGAQGNSARLLERIEARLAPQAELVRATLAGAGAQDFAALAPSLRAADGFVIATGTHWDSWSSPLQKFLEDATPAEATELWLGKPVAVVVSEHSTGGKGVLSRLQGVLVTFGCAIPPLSGLVISKSTQLARRHGSAEAEDFWCADDLVVVADNLLTAARQPRAAWRAWSVDRADYAKAWVE